MAETSTLEITLPGGADGVRDGIDQRVKVLFERPKKFTFTLLRKPIQLGDVSVDQFWMSRASVYGTGRTTAINRPAILDYMYWKGVQTLAVLRDGYLDSLILAYLFPYARSHGSQRIFADAVLAENSFRHKSKQVMLRKLNQDLMAVRYKRMGLNTFQKVTTSLLGPERYSPRIWQAYKERMDPFFTEARAAIRSTGIDGVREPIYEWKKWMSSIGRHAGHEIDKLIFDILSHEIRAALNRCYTMTWFEIIDKLRNSIPLTPQSVDFHRLWHLELCGQTNNPGRLRHAFHGHVPALHPAAAMLISTETGRQTVGDWLSRSSSRQAYERVLHSLSVAIVWYAETRNEIKNRRNSRKERTGGKIE